MTSNIQLAMMLLPVCFKLVLAATENIELELLNWDRSVAGLACILERQPYTTARGWKFNTQSEGCEMLPASWFAEQTIQPDEHYFIVTTFENVFEKTTRQSEDFPAFFSPGCTSRVYIHTANHKSIALKFWVNSGFMPFTYGIDYEFFPSYDHFNSIYGGSHGTAISVPQRVTLSQTTYKIDFVYTATEYQVYVDDVHLKNFARRHADKVDVPNYFECKIDGTGDCLRILFLCPSITE